MRVLNTTEIESVSGGTWLLWCWFLPKPVTCVTAKPVVAACAPVKTSSCGTPAPAPTPTTPPIN